MSEIFSGKLSHKELKKSHDSALHGSSEKEVTDFDRSLEVKIIELESKIRNNDAGDRFSVGENEKRSHARGMKMEKISDTAYAVRSYGYSMEFNADKRKVPNIFAINYGGAHIVSEKIETILTICNMVNFGIFTVANNIKDSQDYLNNKIRPFSGENINQKDPGDIFNLDHQGKSISIKPNPKELKNKSFIKKLVGNRAPSFYSIWNDVNNDGTINKHGRGLMSRDDFRQLNIMLNHKVNEVFRTDNKNNHKIPLSFKSIDDKFNNAG